jgi:hypothetical protein
VGEKRFERWGSAPDPGIFGGMARVSKGRTEGEETSGVGRTPEA